MRTLIPALTLPLLFASCGLLSTQPAADPLRSSDANVQFMVSAAQSNLFEIQSSQQAVAKTSNATVKQYAQDMISMHTDSQNKLSALASARSIKLPDAPSPEQRLILQALAPLSGTEFDQQYGKAQLNGHRLTLDVFDSYIKSSQATDAGVKQFAVDGRPMILDHRERARTLPLPADPTVLAPLNR